MTVRSPCRTKRRSSCKPLDARRGRGQGHVGYGKARRSGTAGSCPRSQFLPLLPLLLILVLLLLLLPLRLLLHLLLLLLLVFLLLLLFLVFLLRLLLHLLLLLLLLLLHLLLLLLLLRLLLHLLLLLLLLLLILLLLLLLWLLLTSEPPLCCRPQVLVASASAAFLCRPASADSAARCSSPWYRRMPSRTGGSTAARRRNTSSWPANRRPPRVQVSRRFAQSPFAVS